jgi:hypothetical protein
MSTPESTAEPRPEAATEVTEPATDVTAEAAEPATEAAEPATAAGAEPAEPAADVAEPATEAMPEAWPEAMAAPSYEATAEPATEVTAEPATEVAEPATAAGAEPAEPATEVTEVAAEAAEPATAAMHEAWPEAMAAPSYETTAEAAIDATAEPATEVTAEPAPEAMPEAWPEAMPEAWPEAMAAPSYDAMPEPALDAMPEPATEAGPVAPGDDLRAAVGLPGQPARGGAQPRGPGRRVALFIGATALLGAIVAGVVFLGRQNQQRYFLVCGEDDITAAQGRSFPPWGRSALEGKAWQAIPRPLDAPCEDRVFDSREGLARSFGETLVARAEAWVTAREDGAGREQLAAVQAQLDQALRVLRELRNPGAGLPELSGKLERLRGDLDYWQARDRIDTAMAELARAAQHLDSAVAHGPHHNRENALMWQRVVARLQAELGRGTPGAAPAPVLDPAASPAEPGAAAGTALPETQIQPGADSPPTPPVDSLNPAAGPTSDAGPAPAPAVPGAAVPVDPPQPPPDAGVARGGLLI